MATLQIRWSTGVKPGAIRPDQLTEFELEVARLGLKSKADMLASMSLRIWVDRNRTRRYVPLWLLAAFGLQVWDCDIAMSRVDS
jgi:hypothetical protein